ncbi:hypothetical protein [Proteiniborus sp. MB09-C3]|uniref:hypothetical protein n=1 Tax=Proteiniborus sp. MB09-C3 TaxID=3050072 RepID=UPI002553E90B|nr:hypothetical protein [Proteiniborus sp. MB09-C3]WIV12256.1 hypothetical protein QO263_00605 [Proteiniborus sp. MB09-C3]
MRVTTEEIISSTDITKKYKFCRDKTKQLGKTVIFKNNVPDMVLMDISVYEEIQKILDDIEHTEIYNMIKERKANDSGKRYSLSEVKNSLKNRD